MLQPPPLCLHSPRVNRDVQGDTHERVSVSVQTVRGQPKEQVTRLDARWVDDLVAFDNADDEAHQVELTGWVDAGHVCRLATKQGTTALCARLRDALYQRYLRGRRQV